MKGLWIACVLGISCLGAKAADDSTEFRQAFARHQEKGTLFYYQTPTEFEAKGWGILYRDAVAEQFKGAPATGLRLEVSAARRYKSQVGEKVALKFRLHNDSDKDVPVTGSGSCKTVHQVGYMVIDTQGRLIQSIGRRKVGGPHCFCKQTVETLKSNSSIQLDTSTVSDAVVGFAPSVAGKYVVIGIYDIAAEENPERRVLSQPLLVQIKEK